MKPFSSRKAMQLLALTPEPNNMHVRFVRDLTDQETADHSRFLGIVSEVNNRLALFRMLQRNYEEWGRLITILRSITTDIPADPLEELNRLLLNYLTCAYSIREHFQVSLVQRFRKDPAKIASYEQFVSSLCGKCWAFGFFLDFRGYFQHCGFGVRNYSRTVKTESAEVAVIAHASDLLKGQRGWKRSNLQVSRGAIDLVVELEQFHQCIMRDYSVYVAQTFVPDLIPAHNFYTRLTQEAKASDGKTRMAFNEGGAPSGNSLTLELIYPPNDLLAELGFQVTVQRSSG